MQRGLVEHGSCRLAAADDEEQVWVECVEGADGEPAIHTSPRAVRTADGDGQSCLLRPAEWRAVEAGRQGRR